ncbi:MAG: restriction endonuclease subunit S [Prosthecobacter sp.]
MKKGWQKKKLVDVATLQRGFDLPTQDRSSGNVPLVTSSGISDTVSKSAVHGPGVATGRSGSIGNVFFIEEDFWPLNTVLYVKDFHGNEPRFVFHLLKNFDLKRFATGAGVPTLNRNFVHDELVNVPPLAEQQRLVGLLDEAFEGLATTQANAEKNLQNARALFESHLQSVFADHWQAGELVTLTDLATDITDGDHLPPPKSPTGVPFITIGNIVKETREIDFSDTFMVPRSYFDALKPYKKPRQGDVLYTVTGSFGIPVIVRDDTEFCFQRHIGLVRPKPGTSSSWLYYLLMSPQLLKQANDGATGTAQKTVSLKLLRSFVVPKVSPKQQKQAVEKLDTLTEETQRLASLYEQKLAALEALKKSLLHQAFTGEL